MESDGVFGLVVVFLLLAVGVGVVVDLIVVAALVVFFLLGFGLGVVVVLIVVVAFVVVLLIIGSVVVDITKTGCSLITGIVGVLTGFRKLFTHGRI